MAQAQLHLMAKCRRGIPCTQHTHTVQANTQFIQLYVQSWRCMQLLALYTFFGRLTSLCHTPPPQDLREEVLAGQGAQALVAIIHSTPGMGLPAQVRVASAAALIALGTHPPPSLPISLLTSWHCDSHPGVKPRCTQGRIGAVPPAPPTTWTFGQPPATVGQASSPAACSSAFGGSRLGVHLFSWMLQQALTFRRSKVGLQMAPQLSWCLAGAVPCAAWQVGSVALNFLRAEGHADMDLPPFCTLLNQLLRAQLRARTSCQHTPPLCYSHRHPCCHTAVAQHSTQVFHNGGSSVPLTCRAGGSCTAAHRGGGSHPCAAADVLLPSFPTGAGDIGSCPEAAQARPTGGRGAVEAR
jgi:hypothetical protein